MDRAQVDRLVNAVLYEGYILYPYRPSSIKNQQRFTFGRVYPRAYSEAQGGREPYVMQTQCLVQRTSRERGPTVEVGVRFLHPAAREVGRLPAPLPELPDGPVPAVEPVASLQVGEHLYQTWLEAVEQDVPLPPLVPDPAAPRTRETPFALAASRSVEPIRDPQGRVAGTLLRRREALEGVVVLTTEPVGDGLYRITVRIRNLTPVPAAELEDPNAVLLRTLASTHTLLHVRDGAFLSLMDPPPPHAEAAAACENRHTWPVLVGDGAKGERDTMLSSPIILYDYPEIAPESPGDLCDGTEIDEILSLRIRTMTDEEKLEMHHVDAFARGILQRTEALPEDHLLKMHGVIRSMGPAHRPHEPEAWEPFGTSTPVDGVSVDGVPLRAGDRVRIRPNRRADAIDMALAGRTAVIESIEQDFEDRIHLALVLDDDPGKDLGLERQSGHRFFYGPDEVEPLRESP